MAGVSARVDDQLCFALYAASRAVTARYREVLRGLDLTYPQYLVLLVLWEQSPLSVGDLGRRLRLDSGTLSPLLKRLETAGLIERRRGADDERTVLVSLTSQGTQLRRRAAKVPDQICAAMGLDDVDRERLIAELNELAQHVDPDVVHTEV